MTSRIKWLDIAKGIAILAVIVGHTVSVGSPVRNVIFSFHMPLFFIVAGYTFKIKPNRFVLISSFKRLLLPYLLLSTLWISRSYFVSLSSFSFSDFTSSCMTIIMGSGYVTPSGIPAVGMAWFLACMFLAKILFNVALSNFDRFNCSNLLKWLFFSIIGALGMLIGGYFKIYLPLSCDVALLATFFMWIGFYSRQKDFIDSINSICIMDIAMVLIWYFSLRTSQFEMATRLYQNSFFAVCAAISGTYLVCRMSMLLEHRLILVGNLLEYIGKNSLLIFCFHAVDWSIPWSSLAILRGVPHSHFVASIMRCAYDVLWAVLVKLV